MNDGINDNQRRLDALIGFLCNRAPSPEELAPAGEIGFDYNFNRIRLLLRENATSRWPLFNPAVRNFLERANRMAVDNHALVHDVALLRKDLSAIQKKADAVEPMLVDAMRKVEEALKTLDTLKELETSLFLAKANLRRIEERLLSGGLKT